MSFKKTASRSLLVYSALICSSAFAGACDIDSCTAPIQTLYVNASGVIYVQLKVTTQDISTLNCRPLVANVYFTVDPAATPNFSSVYAMLLAAAHAGRAVHLRAADNTPGCSLVYLTESF